MQHTTPGILFAVAACAAGAAAQPDVPSRPEAPEAPAAAPRVRLTVLEDRVRVEVGDELFTEYRFTGLRRPVLYPVLGPGGTPMTRRWPLESAGPGESKDHPHHQSLWFAHGAVNGRDFWTTHPLAGRIEHERIVEVRSGDEGLLRTRNRWMAGRRLVCEDKRTLRFRAEPGARSLDYEVTLLATHGRVVLGDTKEGTMAIRMHPALRLRGKVAAGRAINSEGVQGRAVWGKRARWIDYWGPIGSRVLGVAILDHPSNLRHPTWWHARDYGLCAANPFGIHHFEDREKGAGDHEIPAGGSLTLRYRFVFHEGDAEQADVEAHWRAFAATHVAAPAPPRRSEGGGRDL